MQNTSTGAGTLDLAAIQTDALVLDRREIENLQPSSLSLMPDGLLAALSESETRDLLAYLLNRAQVPLPRPKRS